MFANAQTMSRENAAEIVTRLFISADQHAWDEIEKYMLPEVVIDYSSMTGKPAQTLSPPQLAGQWKQFLPGFESTHHQLGNFIVSHNTDTVHVFCYGTASHYLPDEGGNVWIVVGSYDIDLMQDGSGSWRIARLKFNFKYQDGNTSLPAKAAERIKSEK